MVVAQSRSVHHGDVRKHLRHSRLNSRRQRRRFCFEEAEEELRVKLFGRRSTALRYI
jgi:hypothetical protein